MKTPDYMRKGILTIFRRLLPLPFLLIVLTGILLVGCTRRIYVPVETTVSSTDTLLRVSARIDTVIQLDSVVTFISGDTVMITRTRYRDRIRQRVDTVTRTEDHVTLREIPVEVETVKEVFRPLRWWQQSLMWLGVALLASALAAIAYLLIRRRSK